MHSRLTFSAPSFFQEATRIVSPNYLPVEMDVLRARTKTTGIYETRFKMGQLSIQCVGTISHPFLSLSRGAANLVPPRLQHV